MPYLERLLISLIESNDLVLKNDASLPELLVEIQEKLLQNQAAVQVGEWLGRTLVQSEFVEELYASDRELYQRLSEL